MPRLRLQGEIDYSDLEFIDSSGLNMVSHLAQQTGKTVVLIAVPESVDAPSRSLTSTTSSNFETARSTRQDPNGRARAAGPPDEPSCGVQRV